jgi:hypothetical protein
MFLVSLWQSMPSRCYQADAVGRVLTVVADDVFLYLTPCSLLRFEALTAASIKMTTF